MRTLAFEVGLEVNIGRRVRLFDFVLVAVGVGLEGSIGAWARFVDILLPAVEVGLGTESGGCIILFEILTTWHGGLGQYPPGPMLWSGLAGGETTVTSCGATGLRFALIAARNALA